MACRRTFPLISLLILAVLLPGLASAQPSQEHWLVGLWDGPQDRVIDVTAVRADGTAQGTMGIGAQQGQAQITVDGSKMRLVNSINNVFTLTLDGDGQLEGTVTVAKDGSVHPWSATRRKRCSEPTPADAVPFPTPKFCFLDTWTFSNGGTQRVVSVTADGFAISGVAGCGGGCLTHYDNDLRTLKITAPDGGNPNWQALNFVPLGPEWKLLDFPLAPKKSWRVSSKAMCRGNMAPTTVDARVIAYEDVTTKAGTFKAFKIQYDWAVTFGGEGRGMRNWINTWWWSPQTRSIVKYTTTAPGGQEFELVSYSLK